MTPSFALKWPLAVLSLLPFLVTPVFGASSTCLVYVGTYTNARSKGIYAWRMDTATGALSPLSHTPATTNQYSRALSPSEIGLAAETANPTYLALSPNNKFLYAVNEIDTFEGKPAGAVSAFSIDAATGKLTFLNQKSSGGSGPCHLTLDNTGKNVLVANYGGGSIENLAVQPDGSLGEATAFFQDTGKGVNPDRQQGPHAHCMALDPANRFAFACDLGIDKILAYHFDAATGKMSPNETPFTSTKPGAGPRHLVFHPDGHQAYLLTEMTSTIVRYSYDPTAGILTEKQTVPLLPADFTAFSKAAEIQVHPSGKFLYGSNRGHDSIAVFRIDPATGNLDLVQRIPTQGKNPRDFTIDPSGKQLFCANQDSDNIVIFNIDQATGALTPSGKILTAPSPVCIIFLPVSASNSP